MLNNDCKTGLSPSGHCGSAAKMLAEGEKVFTTNGVDVFAMTITKIFYDSTDGGIMFDADAIGNSIFLTQADAEKERDRIMAGFANGKN